MNRKKVTFLYDEKYLKKLESENAELKAKERKYFLDRIEAVESLPINKWKKKFPDFYSWLLQEGFVYKEEFDQGQCKSEIENLHSENAELKKELNEVGRKWLNDFSRQDTLITELKARWEKLKNKVDILSEAFDSEEEASAYDQAVLDIQGIMQELEKKGMK